MGVDGGTRAGTECHFFPFYGGGGIGASKNQELQTKLAYITANNEIRYEEYLVDDADLLIVAFGTAARVAQTAIQRLRRDGLKVGLFRPITLWPFPSQRLTQLTHQADTFLVLKMNAGQMVHDVRAAAHERVPVHFYGRMGGVIPMPDEVAKESVNFCTSN